MRPQADPFRRFVYSIHRRMVLIRLAESLGLGLGAASLVALLVLPILIYRGEEIGSFLACAAGVGAFAGGVFGLMRRYSLLATLIDADRQLKLHDLLSTAWMNREKSDSWAQTVLAMAQAHCAGIRPREVVLARLGSRAWGGIGLSIALVVTLSLLPSTQPASVVANDGVASELAFDPSAQQKRLVPSSLSPTSEFPVTSRPNESGESSDASQIGSEAAAQSSQRSRPRADAFGAGGGIAQTKDRTRSSSVELQATNRAGSNASGAAAGGTGVSGAAGTAGSSDGASRIATATVRRVAPWQSTDWPAARQAALHSADTGQIPAEYRDLVREYFDR